MGVLMSAHDWAATSLGVPGDWPQALRTTVRLALNTPHPAFIFWGPDLVCFYNDAYSRIIGRERHPVALGQPGREVWAETWHVIGPQIEQVMAGRGATWHEDQLVPITREGRREDAWWTYSYSPIHHDDASGAVGGVLVLCNEVTEQHLAREAMRESEARFRAVFDSGLLGLTVFDAAAGHTLAINDRALEIIDCTREEFEAGLRGCLSATPPEHMHLDGNRNLSAALRRAALFG
jgi:PAS domain-containing protein